MHELMDLEIQGQLVEASNGTYLCTDRSLNAQYVYKPVTGERPLWDFPSGTLTGREIAAYNISKILEWNLVPETIWLSQGPLGPGMAQQWIVSNDNSESVNVFSPGDVPEGWIPILSAQDSHGNPLILAHEDSEQLRRIALFDAVINNGDRKAGHLLTAQDGTIYAIDHGVCFHHENKLRTVLWGWLGTRIDPYHLDDLKNLRETLDRETEMVDMWLSSDERHALRHRLDRLILTEKYPAPSQEWPAIPWPVF